jgi:hypothetical protein
MSKGMMAGAHPTAPGGMSQAALVKELIQKHGWPKTLTTPLTWPQMIEAVIQERADREAEANISNPAPGHYEQAEKAMDRLFEEHEGEPWGQVEEALVDAGLDPMDDRMFLDRASDTDDADLDPAELMAELSSIRDEQEEHEAAHALFVPERGTRNYLFDGHAGAGPSASERWMSCTASLGASREFLETLTPNQQREFANSGEAARQGTTAHAAAEVEANVILGNLTQEEADLTLLELAVIPESEGEAYDEEMGEYIVEYVDLVKSYAQERGSENVLIEHRVSAAIPLTDLHEGEVYEVTGSGDVIVLPLPPKKGQRKNNEHQTLVVGDLKYGNGIWVGVDENSQAKIYALGALALLVDENGQLPEWLQEVILHIVQPRMDGIKTATLTVEELLDWRDEVLAPALTKALYGQGEGATFVPSEGACQFCPARGGCAALAEQRMEAAADLFDVQIEGEHSGEGFPETTALTDTRLGELLAQITGLIDLHKDLKAETERRLYRGGSVPGFQLVNYSPPRKWKAGAEEALAEKENLWIQKLVTPTQAEKMMKKEYAEIEALVDKPDKRPVVAKEGDRRKTWEGKPPEAMFEDESGDE